MPWNLLAGTATVVVLLLAWIFRRRRTPPEPGPTPDVGQPPESALPIAEPRMEDTGLGAYSTPLPAVDDGKSERE